MNPPASTDRSRDRGPLRDTLLIGAGQALSMLVALLTVWLLTTLVPAETFGAFMLLMGGLMLVRNTLLAPLFHTILRFYADAEVAGDAPLLRRVIESWRGRLVLAIALCTALAAGAMGLFSVDHIVGSIAVGATLLIFVVRDMEISWLNATRQHWRYTAWTVADAVMKPLMLLAIFAVARISLNTMLIGQAAALAGVALLFMSIRKKPQTTAVKGDINASPLAGKMLRYLLPVIPLPLLGWITGMSDRYIIGWTLDLSQVGRYAAVYSIMSAPFLMLDRIAMLAFQARYFRAVAKEDRVAQRRILLTWTLFYLSVGVTGWSISVLASDLLGQWLLAPEYRSAAELMPWIAGGNLLLGCSRIIEARLHARKRPQYVLVGRIAGAVAACICTLCLVVQMGLLGAAVACPIYFAVQCLALAALARSQHAPDTASVTGTANVA